MADIFSRDVESRSYPKGRPVWISSFVVTLDESDAIADETHAALVAMPGFEVGERIGAKLPVVVEAEDGATARDWYEWTCGLPGVIHVDLAFVGFDETDSPDERTSRGELAIKAGG